MKERRRRLTVMGVLLLACAIGIASAARAPKDSPDNNSTISQSQVSQNQPPVGRQSNDAPGSAAQALEKLPIKGRAPMTGYNRKQFGGEWADEGSCTMRDKILARDMSKVTYRSHDDCDVMSGTLNDPYTGQVMHFARGASTSSLIQIDHVVAIGNAWQTGAQQLEPVIRERLYNDPLELIAVDGKANNDKSDGDAATWLPPNKEYRCRYIARQVAVKITYSLWVTQAEHNAMARVLNSCPEQRLPASS